MLYNDCVKMGIIYWLKVLEGETYDCASNGTHAGASEVDTSEEDCLLKDDCLLMDEPMNWNPWRMSLEEAFAST
jgi:hypothetical protein